jgi:hypothetical protein
MKIKILFIIFISFLFFWETFWDAPLKCSSLIWCEDSNAPLRVISDFIWEFIKYIAIIAVMSVMVSGIFYLISIWEEEKAKKAKKWIIWSMVWVLLSVSAWYIIHSINNLGL